MCLTETSVVLAESHGTGPRAFSMSNLQAYFVLRKPLVECCVCACATIRLRNEDSESKEKDKIEAFESEYGEE